YRAIPEGCKTVLFPGCALSGTRPNRVKELFSHLRKSDPSLGIVLDCCTKPSHDLGRSDHFNVMFSELRDFLVRSGVETILTACPSCQAVFGDYGGGLSVSSVYEVLAREGGPETPPVSGAATVHDSCATRFERSVHEAVREIVRKKGLTLAEMSYQGHKTFCCGEGGAVGHFMPKLAGRWSERRKSTASGNRLISYCAGCTGYLGGSHVLDLVFEPHAALEGRVRVSRAPMTYWNRLRLKRWFKRGVRASIKGARPPLSPMGKVFSVAATLIDLVASIVPDGGGEERIGKGR
ncbi:MAG: heterodisulfide reductase-related iron-sulfur binding cluster, partial [Acidobacteriota bacterium]